MGLVVGLLGAAAGAAAGVALLGDDSGDTPDTPAPLPVPQIPEPVAAPSPTVSDAPEAATETPVIDTEAAKVRAQKRRKAAEDENLIGLTEPSTQKKTLLGD